MRKTNFGIAFLTLLAVTAAGQVLKKTERVEVSQVPLAILQAFENDFGKMPADGYWTASFIVERQSTRSVARPLSYTYHKRNKSEKIEVRYLASGTLEYARGLERTKSPAT